MSLNDLATRVNGITAAVEQMNASLQDTVQIASQAGATFSKFPTETASPGGGVVGGSRSSGPGGGGAGGGRAGGFSGASRGGGGGDGGARLMANAVGDAVARALAAGFRQQATNYGLDFRTRGVR